MLLLSCLTSSKTRNELGIEFRGRGTRRSQLERGDCSELQTAEAAPGNRRNDSVLMRSALGSEIQPLGNVVFPIHLTIKKRQSAPAERPSDCPHTLICPSSSRAYSGWLLPVVPLAVTMLRLLRICIDTFRSGSVFCCPCFLSSP